MSDASRRRLLRSGLVLAGCGLLSGCGLGPLAPPTPTRKVARVGYLGPTSARETVEAFRAALRERGWVEGQQVVIEARLTGSSPQDAASAAAELEGLSVDLVVTNGNSYALAIRERSSTMPIVLSTGADPVKSGLAASLARPGGMVTGVTSISHQLSAKRLALLKEAVPGLRRVGALWNAGSPTKADEWHETEQAAAAVGVQVVSLGLRVAEDFETAVETIRRDDVQGLLVFVDSLTNALLGRIIELVTQRRLPLMVEFRQWAEAGALMTYGPSSVWQVGRVAEYVDKILKGARPADLPIEQPTVFDFVLNLKAAQSLGITVAQSIMTQVTAVIE